MPNKIKSKKQYNFFQMMAHSPEKSKKKGVGPSPSVAREMIMGESKKKRKVLASK